MNFSRPAQRAVSPMSIKYLTTIFLFGCISLVRANAFVFTIDSLMSSLTLSGSAPGGSLQQQGPGSLVTTYSGTIDADYTGSTIQFNSAGADAAINGTWQPLPGGGAGSAPADYGATQPMFSVFGAGRNIVFNITSGVIVVSAGNFDASQLTISPTTGDLDYRSILGGASTDLSGLFGSNAATAGNISIVGGIATLTIPVQITETLSLNSTNDTTITLAGNIVATAVVPEGSISSLLIAGGIFLVVARRAQRRLFASSKRR
jgi:hypothetical protein